MSVDLSRFPRRRYTASPTPLEALPRFSAELAKTCPGGHGPEVWIKRDDQLGLFPGGNKTRKLEFLVADALAQGADTLITCGAPQSNHCRLTLAAAAREGLKCRLLIEERHAGSYQPQGGGNQLMFQLLGVEALTVVPAGTDLDATMAAMAAELQGQGRRAYCIPVGGSNAFGGLGYVACAQELLAQCTEQQLAFDHVLLASGSAGTQAGLLVGLRSLDLPWPVLGVGISRDPGRQQPLVHADTQALCRLLELPMLAAEQVQCVDSYWQPGYALPNAAMFEAVHWLARSEGVVLDPVYTGKAMAGLIGLARSGHFQADDRVLFLHTGGLPALFAYQHQVLDGPAVSSP